MVIVLLFSLFTVATMSHGCCENKEDGILIAKTHMEQHKQIEAGYQKRITEWVAVAKSVEAHYAYDIRLSALNHLFSNAAYALPDTAVPELKEKLGYALSSGCNSARDLLVLHCIPTELLNQERFGRDGVGGHYCALEYAARHAQYCFAPLVYLGGKMNACRNWNCLLVFAKKLDPNNQHATLRRVIGFLVDNHAIDLKKPNKGSKHILYDLHCWDNPETVKFLLDRGALVTRKKEGCWLYAPLCSAAQYGTKETVELLLELNADPCEQDDVGRNALFDCPRSDIMLLLIERGALLNHQDKYGNTPFEHAFGQSSRFSSDTRYARVMEALGDCFAALSSQNS